LPVEIQDLTVRYGHTTALDRLSVRLPAGRIYGLIGRNGSGKSTLLSVLAAFRRASSGTVRVGGQDPFENESVTRQICLIRESGDVFGTATVDEVLGFAGALRPGWDRALADSLVDRFELPRRRTPDTLSRGQRSALACTLGLASRAPLTIFDESYLGMDAPSRYAFYQALLDDYAAHPRTVILSTHLVEEYGSLFEDVVMLHDPVALAGAGPAQPARRRRCAGRGRAGPGGGRGLAAGSAPADRHHPDPPPVLTRAAPAGVRPARPGRAPAGRCRPGPC
jgi:ABC-2 type transport system ATP-binding protein